MRRSDISAPFARSFTRIQLAHNSIVVMSKIVLSASGEPVSVVRVQPEQFKIEGQRQSATQRQRTIGTFTSKWMLTQVGWVYVLCVCSEYQSFCMKRYVLTVVTHTGLGDSSICSFAFRVIISHTAIYLCCCSMLFVVAFLRFLLGFDSLPSSSGVLLCCLVLCCVVLVFSLLCVCVIVVAGVS